MDIKSTIRVIEDYPKEGISFKDITTLLKNKEAYKETIDLMAEKLKDLDFDYIIGIESRGFIRKPGKLPGEIKSLSYDLEYGQSTIEIHDDALKKGDKVVIVDDLIATGGSAKACTKLVESLGGEIVCLEFLIELTSLKAREELKDYKVISLIEYDH